jgi:RimJ/RimL family protein N-acetyltransferase
MPSPHTDIVIRATQAADVAALRELRLDALRRNPLAFTADLDEWEARPMEWWADLARRGAGDGAQAVFVADRSGELVGMTGIGALKPPKQAHAGWVWGVYVIENARGRGVGERLLRAAIDWARRKGLLVIRLGVAEGNDSAYRCYERCGFVTYGVEPLSIRWEGKLYDERLMGLRL